ncbi:MAG TPA: FkbM family methyltransferase [Verrucomicrobiae bacterium]|nr:FkbM family methyltransferase [Verrucomicrobiae bacterium]
MNPTIRRVLTSNSLSRRLYFAARQAYRIRTLARGASRHFLNVDELKSALQARGEPGRIDLRTMDGLTITIRKNYGDAMTVSELFVSDCYVRDVAHPLPNNPVIIDIGGFIGDFALYAVKRLNARKVIVCEPSPKNWALLLKNIANNGYEDRIVPVNKAVTDGRNIMMNIDAPDECQCMVSAYDTNGQPLSSVPGISLGDLLREHAIENVDLLKMDCEGGEYEILDSTSADVLSRIRNIVVEFHDLARLESMKQRLRHEGYALHIRAGIVTASRPSE